MKRKSIIGLAVLFAAIVALAGVYGIGGGHAPDEQPALTEINSQAIAAIQTEFNRARGLRVILLLSPT